jgi:alpha-L-rhamnosidase/Glycosyl hydrolases family 2, sugar binding domain
VKLTRFIFASAWLCLIFTASAAPADSLEAGFQNPPASARPQTWWHWMNGNITKAGITADLEAMKDIGLGGATIVNVDCGIPPGPVKFMSPEWREDFKFAVAEADRLGLELCVENCAGWSSSGGPWNTVTNAMQRLTSSETRARGPAIFNAVLPQPPVTLGFYRDIAVLAFKAPVAEVDTASDAAQSAAKLKISRAVYEAEDGSGSADVKAKLVALIGSGHYSIVAGNDEFDDPAYGHHKRLHVEYTLDGKSGTMTVTEGETLTFPTNAHQMASAQLFVKTSADHTFVRPPAAMVSAASGAIPRAGVVDLTAMLTADGRLRWDVPPGNWVILRLGYTPTGVNNHPAPEEGEGLECDKFSQAALDAHWAGFMQKILDDLGPLAGKTLDSSLIDSYEVGGQDWSENFRNEFQKRRGYDPLKYLPTFTGRVVDNPAVTERFLWDMRRIIADLFAENYFGHFAELCHHHGLKNAVEPYSGPFESLQSGAPADVVMGEFWTGSQGHPSVKLAASIAHIYGKNIVGAESFTATPEAGRWQNDPYSLKTLGDLMYCQGLNSYVFHRYAMQPWTNRWPGMTMGQWGFHFERTETWWNQGKPWIDYITHCQFLLQQGRAVADAAYFTGESAPVEMRAGNPALPAGYDYDAINADVLLHGATVKNGRITLASGASYAVLILPPDDVDLTPQTLLRICELVRAGATVVGPRPQHSPSLAGFPECDAQVSKIAGELWGKCDGTNVLENIDGKGRIVWGKSLADVFVSQNLKPDFEFQGADAGTQLTYAHRITDAADIYFVSNQRRQFDSAECTFRVTGKIPELWHPDTGVIEPAPVWSARAGRTHVRLDFEPAGSVFVIFRDAAGNSDQVVAVSGNFATEPVHVPKLEIQHAVYTAIDNTDGMDVTAKLSGLIRDGQFAVVANNNVMGHDPAANHEKELRVDYILDGIPGHAVAHENETLTLPVAAAASPAPSWEPVVTTGGSPAAKVWCNGQIEWRTASGKILRATMADLPAPQDISGEWTLSFPPDWGAPPAVTLDRLISWTSHTNEGVRYFSGTAIYEKEIEIPAGRLSAGRELWLDLGAVKNFAEVFLNGQELGVLWKPPFRVNITAAAKSGGNRLAVKVTNLWPNRLIGDEHLPPDCVWDGKQLKAWPQWLLDGQPSPTGRLTFTTWHHWTQDSPLLESGLLGPVTLCTAETIIPAN